MPSRGSGAATAVASTTVSPEVTTAAPDACLAIRPVSNCSRLPPASWTEASCFMLSSFLSGKLVRGRASRAQRATGRGERAGSSGLRCWVDPVGFCLPQAAWERCSGGSLLFRILVARAPGLRCARLLANAQLRDHGPVTLRIVRLQVIEQAAALADQHEQTAARGMILHVGLEVLGQIADTLAEDRDLHLGAAGVGVMGAIAGDNFGFFFGCQHVCAYSSEFSAIYTS